MSLAIDVDEVIAVLLGNQWYPVSNKSFDLDAYEYLWYPYEDRTRFVSLLGGGNEATVPATGFSFKSNGRLFCGPITSIQAVEVTQEEKENETR